MEGSAVDAVRSADAVVVMTEWKAFETLDLADLADHMADPVMLDMRNLFSERRAADSGFRRYERVGRSCGERSPADPAAEPANANADTRPQRGLLQH
ncbi:UDP-glucose 6-dehydrogenase, partial [Burkholderia cepacia]